MAGVDIVAGRLSDARLAPAVGERSTCLARLGAMGSARVEHILSGQLEAPVDFVQEDDEWVVLLTGSATVVVADHVHELSGGDWLLIPGGVAHQLCRVTPGSTWLAVHAT